MSTIFDNFFLLLTSLGNYALVWIILALLVALNHKNKAKKIILTVMSSLAFSYLITTILKLLFRFPRPISNFEFQTRLPVGMVSNLCPTDFSFPSGHTATSFAAALILAHFDPKRKWIYFTLAGLIAYSRIYLNCHHVIDVIVGAVLGMVISIIVLKIALRRPKPLAKKKSSR